MMEIPDRRQAKGNNHTDYYQDFHEAGARGCRKMCCCRIMKGGDEECGQVHSQGKNCCISKKNRAKDHTSKT